MNELTIPRKLNFLVFTLAVIGVLFVFSTPAMAQATTGTLKGSVVDPQGASIAGATVYGQQVQPKLRSLPVEVFQVLGLPLNIHEAVLEEKASGYVVRCRMANESTSEIRGLRYSLTAIDPGNGSIPIASRIEGFNLQAQGTTTITFVTPIKFKMKEGNRLVLMLEQVLGVEAIWEVIKPRDALEAYLKGDYSIQPQIMRVANYVDAPPQTRVIH